MEQIRAVSVNIVETGHLDLRRGSPLDERAVVVVTGKNRPSVLRALFDVRRESCRGPEKAFECPFLVCCNPLLALCSRYGVCSWLHTWLDLAATRPAHCDCGLGMG